MRTRLVRVRRKPRGMRWAVFFLMLAMAAYIGAAMPALRKMQAAQTGASMGGRVTRQISLKALEIHMVSFGEYDTAHAARVEAARYVPRGAAGYVMREDGLHVIGAGYSSAEEADRVCAQLAAEEGLECRTVSRSVDGVTLRMTAGSEQIAAFLEGEEALRSCADTLGKLSFSIDRGEANASQAAEVIAAQYEKLNDARKKLEELTADDENQLFAGLQEMIGDIAERLKTLSRETGAMALSSGLKYAHVEFRLREIEFMNALGG